jgi:hypothetical protein
MNMTPLDNQFAKTGDFKVASKTPAPASKLQSNMRLVGTEAYQVQPAADATKKKPNTGG